MLKFVTRRLIQLIPILIGLSILVFIWIRTLPGGPAEALLGERATPEAVERVKELYGLDRPVWQQYLTYVGSVVRLDFGQSVVSRRPVVTRNARPVRFNAIRCRAASACTLLIPGTAMISTRSGESAAMRCRMRSVPS